jgi:hypothetical protein
VGAVGSLAQIVRAFTQAPPVRASMVPLNDDGSENEVMERGFQYFPESVTDTRGVNWVSKVVPGASHPLYQFISGTDRNISFTAFFTSDENPDSGDFFDKLTKGFSLASLLTSNKKKHVVNVAAAIAWLRSFTFPTYQSGYAQSPPIIRLYLPNSGINGQIGGSIVPDSVDVIMTQCDVTYQAFYRQGYPRIASVSLAFNEIIQVGDYWRFVDRENFEDDTQWYDNYNVEPVRNRSTIKPSFSGLPF